MSSPVCSGKSATLRTSCTCQVDPPTATGRGSLSWVTRGRCTKSGALGSWGSWNW
ncbi:MAG TPA: hypothetical protein VFS43_16455 [Polyangiaceae bacterium]|nr:hypothetical protein [Polyangiaceae bacterium]